MANFDKAAKRVLKLEGGFQMWRNDKGNYNANGQLVGTNFGVSAATYEWYTGELATTAKIRAITKVFALAVYRKLFWNRILADRIENQAVAEIFFDGVIQHGRGVHLMQQVLNVKQDGIVGEITLGAINRMKPDDLYTAYKAIRADYYKQLVALDESQAEFYDGWMSRLESFKDYVPDTRSIMTGVAVLVSIFFSLIP